MIRGSYSDVYHDDFQSNIHSKRRNNVADRTRDTKEQQKNNAIFEQLWLTYFNDTLYAKGIITEEQRNKMRIKIKNRTVSTNR